MNSYLKLVRQINILIDLLYRWCNGTKINSQGPSHINKSWTTSCFSGAMVFWMGTSINLSHNFKASAVKIKYCCKKMHCSHQTSINWQRWPTCYCPLYLQVKFHFSVATFLNSKFRDINVTNQHAFFFKLAQ